MCHLLQEKNIQRSVSGINVFFDRDQAVKGISFQVHCRRTEMISELFLVISMYGLLTKREVKMAGYWPSSLFACGFDLNSIKLKELPLDNLITNQ